MGGITITNAATPVKFTDTLNGTVSAPFTGTLVGSSLTGGLSGTYLAPQSGLLQGTYFSINVPTAPGTLTRQFNDLSGNSGSTTLGPWSGTLAGLGTVPVAQCSGEYSSGNHDQRRRHHDH